LNALLNALSDAYAVDAQAAARLWELSEQLLDRGTRAA
jgi:hypothetical protein